MPKVRPTQLKGFTSDESGNLSFDKEFSATVFHGDGSELDGVVTEEEIKWCGFENRTSSVFSMDGAFFTITPSPNYGVWVSGVRFLKDAVLSVEITNDKALHFIYFDSSGNLQASTTAWNLEGVQAPAALVYKDGSTYAFSEERHHYLRDYRWHKWAHLTLGTRYYQGFTGVFGDDSFSIAQGTIFDEDILFNTGSTRTNGWLWHRDGLGSMRLSGPIAVPYAVSGTDLAYDLNGTLTPVGNNRYVCNYIYASSDLTHPIQILVGQQEHNQLTAARSEQLPSILLDTAEWKLLYRVIYSGATPTFVEAQDYRNVSSGPAVSAVSSDHQALINRDASDAHPLATETTNGFLSADEKTFLSNLNGSVISSYANFASFPATGLSSNVYYDEEYKVFYLWENSQYNLIGREEIQNKCYLRNEEWLTDNNGLLINDDSSLLQFSGGDFSLFCNASFDNYDSNRHLLSCRYALGSYNGIIFSINITGGIPYFLIYIRENSDNIANITSTRSLLIEDDVFYFFGVAWDSVNRIATFYLNGDVFEVSSPQSLSPNGNSTMLWRLLGYKSGRSDQIGNKTHPGQINRLYIYNKALNSSEAKHLFYKGVDTTDQWGDAVTSGCLACFEENTINTATWRDVSDNKLTVAYPSSYFSVKPFVHSDLDVENINTSIINAETVNTETIVATNSAGEQLTAAYSESVKTTFETDSSGNLEIALTGNKITISDLEINLDENGINTRQVSGNIIEDNFLTGTKFKNEAFQLKNVGVNWVVDNTFANSNWRGCAVSKNGGVLYAAPLSGYIQKSLDGGSTWVQCTAAGSRAWIAVACSFDGKYVIAAVADVSVGYIYYSSNFGVTWSQSDAPASSWQDVCMSADGKYCYAAGNGRALRISSNYGVNWDSSTQSIYSNWAGIACSSDGKYVTACLSDGVKHLHRSDDYGVNFTAVPGAGAYEWYKCAMSADGKTQLAIATGTTGTRPVVVSYDFGSTWSAVSILGDAYWRACCMSFDGKYMSVFIYGGGSYYLSNNGLDWTASDAPNQNWRYASCSGDGRRQFAVTYGEKIYISEALASSDIPLEIERIESVTATSTEGPQFEAAYSESVKTTFETDSSGNLEIAPSGAKATLPVNFETRHVKQLTAIDGLEQLNLHLVDANYEEWHDVTSGLASSLMYVGGVLMNDGRVFMVPFDYNAAYVIFDPSTNNWVSAASAVTGSNKFAGGVLLSDGRVFLIPASYTGTKLIFNPSTNDFEDVTVGLAGAIKFVGGVLLPDGRVFMVPRSYEGTSCIFNPATNDFDDVTAGIAGAYKNSGGVLLPDGRVFMVPSNYTGTKLIFNPTTNDFEDVTAGLDGSSKFVGGVLLPDGRVFMVPFNYTGTSHIFNPATNDFETTDSLVSSTYKYYGGVLLPDGRVFMIPYHYPGTTLIFNPSKNGFETVSAGITGDFKFAGGVLLPDGRVFMVPHSYTGTSLIYNPPPTRHKAEPWCYHPCFNKL